MGLEPSFKFVSMNKCTKINPAETLDKNNDDHDQNTETYNKINHNRSAHQSGLPIKRDTPNGKPT